MGNINTSKETGKAPSAKEIFANNLNHQIKRSGKSVYQIEKETNISHSHIYALCDFEKKKLPSPAMTARLASYFNIEISDFWKIDENQKRK